jgi:crotonobetainyl-CoA:carnitine CoA-transferase CaiB-like acyl-CoA transferase
MTPLPLHGVVVADYSQYVAGPLCTVLLADLGADVIKVEPPQGDQWRRQEPCGEDVSGPFLALNRNKRSIVLDLKSDEGRRASASLIANADVVIHNYPPDRAAAFGLAREAVSAANPCATLVVISAFGSDGVGARRTAYDLNAQAASGLLMADARLGDQVPIRAGGIAMADLSAGMLAAVAALAGLARARATGRGGELEVSLLGAGLAVQIQRFVSIEADEAAGRAERAGADAAALDRVARQAALGLRINPYYRAYATADGFLTIACLNMAQRQSLLEAFGLEDRAAANPDELPATPQEARRREGVVEALASALARRPTREWTERLRARGVPCEEVRTLESLFDDAQVEANGLVQEIDQPGLGPVRLLGNVFKVDREVFPAERPGPARGEHTEEVLRELRDPAERAAARA